jgi:hypothetical protein
VANSDIEETLINFGDKPNDMQDKISDLWSTKNESKCIIFPFLFFSRYWLNCHSHSH